MVARECRKRRPDAGDEHVATTMRTVGPAHAAAEHKVLPMGVAARLQQ